MVEKITKKFSLSFIAFLQAAGLTFYCLIVGFLIWEGNKWFGPINTFTGPIFFLILFVASALISGLLAFGYPIILFWDKKQTKEALKLVAYTTAWLVFFVSIFLAFLISLS